MLSVFYASVWLVVISLSPVSAVTHQASIALCSVPPSVCLSVSHSVADDDDTVTSRASPRETALSAIQSTVTSRHKMLTSPATEVMTSRAPVVVSLTTGDRDDTQAVPCSAVQAARLLDATRREARRAVGGASSRRRQTD